MSSPEIASTCAKDWKNGDMMQDAFVLDWLLSTPSEENGRSAGVEGVLFCRVLKLHIFEVSSIIEGLLANMT